MSFSILPTELIIEILSYLELFDLMNNVHYVCKTWQNISSKIIYDMSFKVRQLSMNRTISRDEDLVVGNACFRQSYAYHTLLDSIDYFFDIEANKGYPLQDFKPTVSESRYKIVSNSLLEHAIVRPPYDKVSIWLRLRIMDDHGWKLNKDFMIPDRVGTLGELYRFIGKTLEALLDEGVVGGGDKHDNLIMCLPLFGMFDDGDWQFSYVTVCRSKKMKMWKT